MQACLHCVHLAPKNVKRCNRSLSRQVSSCPAFLYLFKSNIKIGRNKFFLSRSQSGFDLHPITRGLTSFIRHGRLRGQKTILLPKQAILRQGSDMCAGKALSPPSPADFGNCNPRLRERRKGEEELVPGRSRYSRPEDRICRGDGHAVGEFNSTRSLRHESAACAPLDHG